MHGPEDVNSSQAESQAREAMSSSDHGAHSHHEHSHGYPHDHPHEHSHLDDTALRVRSLQTLLSKKGYIDPAALGILIDTYENKVGPRNGAALVAKAWASEDF